MACASSPVPELPIAGQAAIRGINDIGLGEMIRLPDSNLYEARTKSYYSLSSQLCPWAIVQPRSTDEVSLVMKVLAAVPECNFAIRSGGHMFWLGANNIISGITIDLGRMVKTTYKSGTRIASLQLGGKWTDVYAVLDEEGVMVAGGREGLVGVGGLLLGGGIALHSCRVGFACDQVVNCEVVLADGRIVEVNKEKHQDLFRALKGGGNNFGIVTRFDMDTFPAHDIWDGTILHSNKETDSVIDALVSLAENLDVAETPDAHYLGVWAHSPQMPDVFITSILTHLDGVLNLESMKKKCTDVHGNLVDHIKAHYTPSGDFVAYSIVQPFPRSFARHSKARGGNMLGVDGMQENSLLLITAIQVETWQLAQAILPKFKAGVADIETYAQSLGADIDFRYRHYCDGSQNPLASYGEENIRHRRDASRKYDPHGVFQMRVPGSFKVGSQNG